ncbi:PQQ-binding-like beta-propeller repeat protein [Streptomyces sp. NPDC015171]|uniref:outer membrane protein assembly factor BamB family protein n=1 Tax=Streptomyces sp. NPDC015171 TaxID=3364945 RepID=UPI00370062BF
MTQPPPPPPNQPPQPPHQPPAQPPAPPNQAPQPGYGYPQAPPPPPPQPQAPAPQPGYGYPGAQQNPYAAQPPTYPAQQPPGYGVPQQNPYAQPGQPAPAAPQGYGYPGQGQPPTVPMQPKAAPGGGGGRNNAVLFIVVAAVAAIALIIGGGVWYAKSSGSDGKQHDTASSGGSGSTGGSGGTTGGGGKEKAPADPAAKVLFQVPLPTADDTVVTSGSWLTDTVYAKSGIAEIVGYDPAKGTKLWTVKLPGPVCAASNKATDDGRTAVAFQPKMPAKGSSAGCSQVAGIDLEAGKTLWTKSIKSGDFPITFENVTVGQRTVAVGSSDGGAAFDIDSGKVLWQPKPDDTCRDAGYGGGARLVAVRKCGSYDDVRMSIQTIDPKSGKVISEYKMPAGVEYASVVSSDPLVIGADVGDNVSDGSGVSDYFSVDGKTGKLLARIPAPADTYGGRCDGIYRVDGCRLVVAGAGRLYLPTESHDGKGEYTKTNEVVSFDLKTGKPTGQRVEAGDGYTLAPLRMDGGNLLAYKAPPYDKGGQIVSVAGASSASAKLLENPATRTVHEAEIGLQPDSAEFLFGKGRLFMSAVYAHKSGSSFGKEYLVMAFGTDG